MTRPVPGRLAPDALVDRVLYRDGLVIIIDKPAGLPVHAGPGGGANLEQGFAALRFGLPAPPSLGHRLDRDTSGCLVLGRHRKALAKLGRLFSGGHVEKTYWAVVDGVPAEDDGTIDLPLLKATPRGGWRMVVDPKGQSAVTQYRVRGRGEGIAWLELRPKTGRTHQIRVHCAERGWAVMGDPVYGRPAPVGQDLPPLHLHARALSFPLYPSRAPIGAVAPVPEHMRDAMRRCGASETDLDAPPPVESAATDAGSAAAMR